MRKYVYIFKSEIMSSLQYVTNTLVGFLGYFVHIFIFFNLWNYIYSNPEELINGYSKTQMIWYVVITEIIWSVVGGRRLCRKISEDVKSGNIAYNMNKPYSYVGYSLSSHLGEGAIKLASYTVLGIGIVSVLLGELPNINILQFIIVIVSMILAVSIESLNVIFIGLLSFKIEDANPVYWIYSKLILILGTTFPIEFFPKALQEIVKFTPIYVVSYGPAKLFANFEIQNAIKIILAQLIYTFISYGLCKLMYKKGVKKLNVNGG